MPPLGRVDLLRNVVDILPVGVWIMDETGKILYGNSAGHRIWAGARYVGVEQLEEYKGWWVATGKRIEAEEWAAARALRKGETSIDEEVEIECFDGTRKIILNSAMPIRDEENHIVREELRSVDLLARYGGEEFMIVTPGIGRPQAVTLAERLRTLIAAAKFDAVPQVTCSFGVYQFDNDNMDSFIRHVDDLLYKAKEKGRNCVVTE